LINKNETIASEELVCDSLIQINKISRSLFSVLRIVIQAIKEAKTENALLNEKLSFLRKELNNTNLYFDRLKEDWMILRTSNTTDITELQSVLNTIKINCENDQYVIDLLRKTM